MKTSQTPLTTDHAMNLHIPQLAEIDASVIYQLWTRYKRKIIVIPSVKWSSRHIFTTVFKFKRSYCVYSFYFCYRNYFHFRNCTEYDSFNTCIVIFMFEWLVFKFSASDKQKLWKASAAFSLYVRLKNSICSLEFASIVFDNAPCVYLF
jgi:hypothetical protein